jgi:hypothetical protein
MWIVVMILWYHFSLSFCSTFRFESWFKSAEKRLNQNK